LPPDFKNLEIWGRRKEENQLVVILSSRVVDNELAKGAEGGCLVHSIENTGNNIQVEVWVIFDVFKVESEFLDATSVEKQTLNMLIMNKGSKCLDNRELIFTRL